MKQKDFKQLLQDKMLLTDAQYDDMFLALNKYGIDDEEIAAQLPDNAAVFGAALPSLTTFDMEGDIDSTKLIQEKLDIDDTTAIKLINWLDKYGAERDNINNLPFGMGDQVNEALDKIGINDVCGPTFTKSDIAGTLGNTLDDYASKKHIANDNTIAEPSDGLSAKEHIGKSIGDAIAKQNFEYTDEEGGFKLVGKGDKMYIYNCIEPGWSTEGERCEPRLVGVVDCPAGQRQEFLSEFKEEAYNQSNYGFARDHKLVALANAVSKDIEDELNISTGNPLTDIKRDILEKEADSLEEKLEKLNNAINELSDNNGVLSEKMRNALEKFVGNVQEELDEIHKKLEVYEALEVENAKEMKTELENTQKSIEAELAKLKEYESENPLINSFTQVRIDALEKELDEVQDDLRAVNGRLILDKMEKLEDIVDGQKESMNIPKISRDDMEILPYRPNQDKGEMENLPYYPGKDEPKIQLLIDKTEESFAVSARAAAPEAKEAVQKCVINIDNIVNDFKDKVVEWGHQVENNPKVQEAINGLKTFCETDSNAKAAIAVGENIVNSEAVQNAWKKVQEFATDAYNHPGVQKFIDKVENAVEAVANNPHVQRIAGDIKDVGNDIINSKEVQAAINGTKEFFGDVADGAKKIYQSEQVQGAIGEVKEFVDDIKNNPKVQEFNKNAKEFARGVHEDINDFIESDKVQNAVDKTKASVAYAVNETKNFVNDLSNHPDVKEFVGNVKDFGDKAVSETKEFLQDVVNHPTVQATADGTKAFVNKFLAGIDVKEFVSDVKEFADKVDEKVDGFVADAKNLGNSIKEEVTSKIEDVKDAWEDTKSWISDKWNKFFGKEDNIELDIDD